MGPMISRPVVPRLPPPEERKQMRDLFKEMMRAEFPDFDSIPEAVLLAAVNGAIPAPAPARPAPAPAQPAPAPAEPVPAPVQPAPAPTKPAPAPAQPTPTPVVRSTGNGPTTPELGRTADVGTEYHCATQTNGSLEELFLGIARGNLTLWKSNSTINWTARSDGYPEEGMALEAARAVYLAAEEWNTAMEGRVTFKYTPVFDDAAFTLTFNNDPGNTLARAFFPDNFARTMNILYVFSRQYAGDVRNFFVATMRHELGHILGLRHEHSQSGIKDWLGPGRDSPPEDRPGGAESILWGSRNPRSVMAYYRGQTIQESDIIDISRAYDELNNGRVIRGEGRFGVIQKTVARVDPNN